MISGAILADLVALTILAALAVITLFA